MLASWWVGLVAGAVVALVACRPRLRFLVTLGAPVALAACAVFVVVQQYRHDYPADLDWPGKFYDINNVAWLAVILLLADLAVERVRKRAANDAPDS